MALVNDVFVFTNPIIFVIMQSVYRVLTKNGFANEVINII